MRGIVDEIEMRRLAAYAHPDLTVRLDRRVDKNYVIQLTLSYSKGGIRMHIANLVADNLSLEAMEVTVAHMSRNLMRHVRDAVAKEGPAWWSGGARVDPDAPDWEECDA